MSRSKNMKPTRRRLFALLSAGTVQASHAAQLNQLRPQRITLAQVVVSRSVEQNVATARRVFARATDDAAGWVLFPEGFLSGYYDGFRQPEVAEAFVEIQRLCRDHHTIGLIGTCWKEGTGIFN